MSDNTQELEEVLDLPSFCNHLECYPTLCQIKLKLLRKEQEGE